MARHHKRTSKKNVYYQFKQGMRELMSSEPIKGMVDSVTSQVYANVSALGLGAYEQTGFVTSEPPSRSDDVSWHGFVVEADRTATVADVRYGVLQLALTHTWMDTGKHR